MNFKSTTLAAFVFCGCLCHNAALPWPGRRAAVAAEQLKFVMSTAQL
jgi:hypothetical protein